MSSSRDSFWLIPPIQDAIALDLNHQDLLHCTRVSNALAQFATPFLWRTAHLTTDLAYKQLLETPALLKNHHHVRDMKLPSHRPIPELHQGTLVFPRLDTIFRSGDSRIPLDQFYSFLACRPMIRVLKATKLVLPAGEQGGESFQRLCRVLRGHGGLEEVDLTFVQDLGRAEWVHLFRGCSQLRKVRINVAVSPSLRGFLIKEPKEGEDEEWNALEEDKVNLIKDLEICLDLQWNTPLLKNFLEQCPHLEQLKLKTKFKDEKDALEWAYFLGRHCPKLKVAELPQRKSLPLEEVFLRAFKTGLTRIQVAVPTWSFMNQGISTLLLHQTTLEEVLMFGERQRSITLKELWLIGQSCPRLKTLEVCVDLLDKGHLNPKLEDVYLDRLNERPWICLGLTTMQLAITGPETRRPFLNALMTRIGDLNALKMLGLYRQGNDPEFGPAFEEGLSQLNGSRWLVDFRSKNYKSPRHGMSLGAFVQMLDMWPRLKNVVFDHSPDFMEDAELRGKLRERRPWLTINGKTL